jgi:hypothetical protein
MAIHSFIRLSSTESPQNIDGGDYLVMLYDLWQCNLRARARFAQEYQDATQLSGPVVTFRSRWGDANNPTTNGSSGLRGLITGQLDTGQSDRDERETTKEKDKKRHKDEKKRRKGQWLFSGREAWLHRNLARSRIRAWSRESRIWGCRTYARPSYFVLISANEDRMFCTLWMSTMQEMKTIRQGFLEETWTTIVKPVAPRP